jgi:hypothetical protein
MNTQRARSAQLQLVVDPAMGALQEPRPTAVCRTFAEQSFTSLGRHPETMKITKAM